MKLRWIFPVIAIAFSAPLAEAQSVPEGRRVDETAKVSPVIRVERSAVVNLSRVSEDWWPQMRNTWVAPRPGMEVAEEVEAEMKEWLKNNPDQLADINGSNKVTGPEDTLNLQQSFFGNGFDGGIPNDNGLAVSRGQKVVSVANSSIRTYQGSSSAVEYQASLSGLAAGQGGAATKYDPKVAYDTRRDRFVVVFLNGFLASNSKIVVAFSETEDPAGNWNIYSLDGSITATTWTDFPQIALSREELFITGNLFTDAGQAQGSVIWQVGLEEGYAGQPLQSRFFQTSFFSLHPVRGGYAPYGNNMYFARNVSNPIPVSKTLFIHEINNTIDSNGVLLAPVTLQSDLNYGVSPDANQSGTSVKLDCNDCRIQNSFFHNDRMELAFNTNSGGKSSIYWMSVDLADNIAFSAVKGKHITFDTLEVGYPGIAPGGCTAGNGANSCVLFFNYTSANHFPGNAAVFIDTTGTVGPPKILKKGFTFMGDAGTSPWRWGDYADAQARPNNPGEVWTGGSVGMLSGGQNRNGTWISKVFSPCCGGPIGIDDIKEKENPFVTAYPNPSTDLVFFDFAVPSTGIYRVTVHELNGKEIKLLVEDKLKEGKAQLRFSTAQLPAGIYFVRIEGDNAAAATRKFVVAH